MSRTLPNSANTIKYWILQRYRSGQKELTQAFARIEMKIHFTFVLWSSPNHRSFLGVVAHWLDSNQNLKSTVLGIRRFPGPHTGENPAKHFWDIITPYNIELKIGYFTLDNVSNNDTALQHISSSLTAINIPFNPIHRRLRRSRHTLNLVVKAFLWVEDC